MRSYKHSIKAKWPCYSYGIICKCYKPWQSKYNSTNSNWGRREWKLIQEFLFFFLSFIGVGVKSICKTPILQRRRLRPRDAKLLAQRDTARHEQARIHAQAVEGPSSYYIACQQGYNKHLIKSGSISIYTGKIYMEKYIWKNIQTLCVE